MPALPYVTDRRYVQGTIEAILSSGMSSRLFQEIREKRGWSTRSTATSGPTRTSARASIAAGTDLDRVEEAVGAIAQELKKLRDEGVPEEELQRTKDLRKGRC
jgi:predicted Zn-dependent peptidase